MPVQSVPLTSLTIGPQTWRDKTAHSIRLAENLVRQSCAGRSGSATPCRPRSCTALSLVCARPLSAVNEGEKRSETGRDNVTPTNSKVRPVSTGTSQDNPTPALFVAPFPPPCLREQCAEASVRVAGEYMRDVRGVEGQLRKQAGRVGQESIKLERERGYLERMLRSLRKDLMVNKKSVEERTLRPATTETGRDGADHLLDHEKKELTELKAQLESTLRDTLTQQQSLSQCSKLLLECASERSRVLDLVPQSGCHSAGGRSTPSQILTKPKPTGPYTPECEQAIESSSLTLGQSQLLREQIRRLIREAIARQKSAHQSVNDGLVKKISETISLKQHLTVSSASTRQAIYRKQRQLDCIQHSHDRALGPVSSADLLSRERLDRPLVQVYQRHPGTQLPEAMHLIQGGTVAQQCLLSSGGQLSQLRGAHKRLMVDLRGKGAAAQVDSAIVRLRRRQVDRRRMPSFFSQGTC